MKIAIVCDWLATIGGAEKTLEQMLACFPEADLFSVVDFLPADKRGIIQHKSVTTSYVQKLPWAKTKFRSYLLFMPFAIEQIDFVGYDVIISSSHAVAKGVLTGPNQLHICYCHSPIRYAWDLQNQYLRASNLDRGFKTVIIRYLLHKIRQWDVSSSSRVDYFIANSNFIAKRIQKYYRRNTDAVIYPPVRTDVSFNTPREQFYLTASRVVPYKKMDLIVEAFLQTPQRKLVVIGDGPGLGKIRDMAQNAPNIKILGYQEDNVLQDYLSKARAFVFAAEEDFGILPVEAQAFGAPVIALARGGALESVIGLSATNTNPTGVFFLEQTVGSLLAAIDQFEANETLITPEACHLNATRFSVAEFRSKFRQFVLDKLKSW